MARRIEIEITGDTRGLERALSRTTSKTQSSFDKISRGAKLAGLAIAGGLAVGAKIAFDELTEMQKVTAQTEAVLKSTGSAANVTADHVRELAESISEYSGQDDEAVQAGENLLLTFHKIQNEAGKGNDIFDQATKAVADLSQAMGMDFKAAALQVGKALNDPARGLTRLQRIGVVFSDGQRKQIEGFVEQGRVMDAQRIILAELNKEFGGSAKAFGETMPGQLKRAQESFRNLGAELLVTLLPAITQIGERLLAFSGFLRENPKLAKGMVIGLAALSAALLTASAAQIALNLAVLANPYVAAAVAIGALVAALVVLDQRTQVVRKHWQLLLIPFGVFPVLIATVAKAVVRNMDSIASAFKHAYDFARRFIVPIAQFFNPIVGAVQRVISYVHQLTSAIQAIPSPGDIGNAILPGNPFGGGRAAGGPVAAGVPYLVGERGPELFVPRGSGTIVPNSRGGGSGGYPGGPVLILTDAATARWLQGLNSRYSRGNGGRSIW